jgi:hypothetical protein
MAKVANSGSFKPGNKGKPKGADMHLTKQMRTVKEVVLKAFNNLQEDPIVNIENWGKENPKDFYNIASKLIPTEISAVVEDKRKSIEELFPEDKELNGSADK